MVVDKQFFEGSNGRNRDFSCPICDLGMHLDGIVLDQGNQLRARTLKTVAALFSIEIAGMEQAARVSRDLSRQIFSIQR